MDNDFGYLLRCEVQTDTARLEPLTWAQGTTPRIIAAPTRNGLIVPADPGTVARMMIAESPTATLWAVVESTDRTENGYILQWPTVGTHTPPGKPWFYTIFFMRDGKRFWTGSGQLTIEETTATGDGLVWQEVATWEDMVGEVVEAVEDKDFSRLTLNGETITQWPGPGESGVSSVNGATGAVAIEPGDNIHVHTEGKTIRISGEAAGQGVPSVNGITGPVTLSPGENVGIAKNGNILTISATGGGGGSSGVQSLNGKTGDISLANGDHVSITPNGNTLTISADGTDPAAAVAAVESANLSTLTLNGSTITEWPSGGGAETARIITTATATVEDGDTLILMDTATAGQAQTLTLPASLSAAAATVTVRQLGTAGVTIAHGVNEYHLTHDGDWVTLDWIAGKGWFWRA